ncbi:PepSY domain-containing protein [Persephonella sp.]
MVTFKIHKWAGILIGFWLLNLTFTGFFLNHEKNNNDLDFLWDVEIDRDLFNEYALHEHGKREITGFKIHPDKKWYMLSSKRGLYINRSGQFEKVYQGRVFKIEPLREKDLSENYEVMFLATDEGVLKTDWNGNFTLVGLTGKTVTSITVFGEKIFAVVDKKDIYLIDMESGGTEVKVDLPEKVELVDDVRFGRFVRDFHYGRGLFQNPYSMWINDVVTVYWFWLVISGYCIFVMYYMLKRKIILKGKALRHLVKTHGNWLSILMIPVILLLSITGLFIDHPRFFRFITSKEVPRSILPPVYNQPQSDIWGIDFDGENLRIGTRYGVYRIDEDILSLESKGFAYKMVRVEDELYISGMGSSNRVYTQGRWLKLERSKRMPLDFVKKDGYVEPVTRNEINFEPSRLPLYTFLLTLHDGSFFHRYFIFLNDASAILVILLVVTGTVRYFRRRRAV